MMAGHRIAGRFFNSPLLLTPAAADTIGAFLLTRLGEGVPHMRRSGGGEDEAREERTFYEPTRGADGTFTVHSPSASRFRGDVPLSEDGSRRPLPFRRTEQGVAIATLVGEWVNRGGYVGASSGVISYEGFAYQLDQMARDSRTRAVVLDLESPGGEAVGAFEAAAAVRQLAAVKPVWALVNGMAASAAYAIASAATRIVSIPTGISGSIGVVLCHLDLSGYLKAEGIKPTLIHAGARKVDANPYTPLPAAVRDRLQAEVEQFYGLFVQTVAAGRSGLTEKAIRETEAGCFMGADALSAGLVDALGSFDDVLGELGTGHGATTHARPASAGRSASAATSIPAANAAPILTENTAVTETEAEGIRASERERFKSILGSPEAKGREAQANELAFNTSLTAETCLSILKAAPRANGDLAAFEASVAGRTELTLDAETNTSAPVTGSSPESVAFWDSVVTEQNAKLPPGAVTRKASGR